MDIRNLTDSFAVSPQIDAAHMKEIAGAGFKSIMCNRPDGEEAGQPDFDSIAEAAAAEGLEVRWVPVVSGMMTPEAFNGFREAVTDMPGPMLAYCRTGTRCTMLWAMTQHGKMDDADIIQRAQEAGYDVSGLVQQLNARS